MSPQAFEAVIAQYGVPDENGDVMTEQAALSIFNHLKQQETVPLDIAPLIDWNQDAKAMFEEPELFPRIRKIASGIIQGDRTRIAKGFKTEIKKAIVAKSKELAGVQ